MINGIFTETYQEELQLYRNQIEMLIEENLMKIEEGKILIKNEKVQDYLAYIFEDENLLIDLSKIFEFSLIDFYKINEV